MSGAGLPFKRDSNPSSKEEGEGAGMRRVQDESSSLPVATLSTRAAQMSLAPEKQRGGCF